ncbi:MAG: Phosphoribosyltransferase [Parcubacteria group bacterium GW2011_GWE2_39_37]|uniref:Phosphoribosyltransferase n=1 Tax=Candidatus Falkowbacteria bacterium GW2011_GWF2_39_8 TaxID=1618642 RepID=A0A0G0SC55_9BACT|nr:MAG: Phosphoribosyltransferase [Parcubacteria group bacterium GW2011_GWE2_39_37]KKR32305.1 MAG: Phosphoribosyltransferase [Candidatus Falkowbacteria bacterium GW2011_GWF2_39_8]
MSLDFKKIRNHAIKWRDFCFDLLFPINCLGCEKEGSWLCDDCFNKIELAGEIIESNEMIKDCIHLDGLCFAVDYNDKVVARLIKTMKYKFIKDINKLLAEFIIKFFEQGMTHGLETIDWKNSIIIPVPLHVRRLKWRGFNQAKEIGQRLALYLNCLFAEELRRVKNNRPQAKLKAEERWRNIEECFVLANSIDLEEKTVFLVDDVATTGATLNECAKVLKAAGAREVWGVVVARG